MLQLDAVTAGYGSTTVLREVTITVPDGAVVALLGPNGAGKTTTLRVASGLLRPTSGRIVVDGTDVTGRRIEQFVHTGVSHVPEGRGVFPGMTVRENLVLFASRGSERTAIERAVDAFPILGQRLGQLAGTMSGGQQQMLALARCYVSNPRVVLLDEVSLGLAPKIVDEIFEFLDRVVAEGASLLLVEQYVVRALRIADYVYVLNRGKVVFAGEPGELDENDVFRSYVGTDIG